MHSITIQKIMAVTICRDDCEFSSCTYMSESDQLHANHANPSWHTRHLQRCGILRMLYHSCIHLFFGFYPHPVFRLKRSISVIGSVSPQTNNKGKH